MSKRYPRYERLHMWLHYIKKDSKSDPLNYRPVSLTCVLCKVYEKIVRQLVCKILLLARTLGLKAKRARDDRVYFIQ